jgi:hypothetical protein
MREPPSELPAWVDTNLKRFYLMLAGKPELIAKVAEEADRYPRDNVKLADSLVVLGIHKQDGTALDTGSMSKIRNVVSRLKTTPESPIPLSSANGQ